LKHELFDSLFFKCQQTALLPELCLKGHPSRLYHYQACVSVLSGPSISAHVGADTMHIIYAPSFRSPILKEHVGIDSHQKTILLEVLLVSQVFLDKIFT